MRDANILIISMVMVKGVKLAYYTAFPGSITAIYFLKNKLLHIISEVHPVHINGSVGKITSPVITIIKDRDKMSNYFSHQNIKMVISLYQLGPCMYSCIHCC